RDFHVTGVQTCALPISAEIMAIPVQITMVKPANTGFHNRIKLNIIPNMENNKIQPQFLTPYCFRSRATEMYCTDLNITKNPITKGRVANEMAGLLNNSRPNKVFKIPPAKYHPHPSISFLLFRENII